MATVLFGRLSNPYATVPVASDQLENLTVFPR
jgi:hypothetical protein